MMNDLFCLSVAAAETALLSAKEETDRKVAEWASLLEAERQKLADESSLSQSQAVKLVEDDAGRRMAQLKAAQDAHWESVVLKK